MIVSGSRVWEMHFQKLSGGVNSHLDRLGDYPVMTWFPSPWLSHRAARTLLKFAEK